MEPEVEHLLVSDITPTSFMLAWGAPEDVFDKFLIRVSDELAGSFEEFTVPRDERTKVISDLLENTEYQIQIYGVISERRFLPVSGDAKTGIGFFFHPLLRISYEGSTNRWSKSEHLTFSVIL